MTARVSALAVGVGRFSRLLRELGVLAMLDAGLDTTKHGEYVCEVPPCAGVLGVAVAV